MKIVDKIDSILEEITGLKISVDRVCVKTDYNTKKISEIETIQKNCPARANAQWKGRLLLYIKDLSVILGIIATILMVYKKT